jgi:hypothetical protein
VEDFAAENVVYLEIRTTPKVLLLNILLHIAYSFVSLCSKNVVSYVFFCSHIM